MKKFSEEEDARLIESIRTMTLRADICNTHHYACDCINQRIVDIFNRFRSELREAREELERVKNINVKELGTIGRPS